MPIRREDGRPERNKYVDLKKQSANTKLKCGTL